MLYSEIHPHDICHVAFDLGGVLYDVAQPRTDAALRALAGPRAERMDRDNPLFIAFERGDMPPALFRERLRSALDTDADDAALDAAWNAQLLGLLPGREAAVHAFAEQYSVCLISNTNAIHAEAFSPECASMFSCMRRAFFSFDMRLRKPDEQVFREVLYEMEWAWQETLFVDDSRANVEAARRVGMRAFVLDPRSPDQFSSFCTKFLGVGWSQRGDGSSG